MVPVGIVFLVVGYEQWKQMLKVSTTFRVIVSMPNYLFTVMDIEYLRILTLQNPRIGENIDHEFLLISFIFGTFGPIYAATLLERSWGGKQTKIIFAAALKSGTIWCAGAVITLVAGWTATHNNNPEIALKSLFIYFAILGAFHSLPTAENKPVKENVHLKSK